MAKASCYPPGYTSWMNMRRRCLDEKDPAYDRYGLRGITFDPRWASFKNFRADMGDRPEGAQLDRIDNDGDYCKENCRWTTRLINVRNSPRTVLTERKALLIKAIFRSVRPGSLPLRELFDLVGNLFGVSRGATGSIYYGKTWK